MDIEKDKRYVFKWHRHIYAVVGFHIVAGIIILLVLIGIYRGDERLRFWIVLGSFLLIAPISFYLFMRGAGAPIYLDDEKVWMKIRGKYYEWRYEDMTKAKKYLGRSGKGIVVIHITTKPDYKKLTFELIANRQRDFLEICTNEQINEQIKKFWS